jgi:hypothetical protein
MNEEGIQMEAIITNVLGEDNYKRLCEWAFEAAYVQAKYYTPCRHPGQFRRLAKRARRSLINDIYGQIAKGKLTQRFRVLPPTPSGVLEKLTESFGYNGVNRVQRILMQKERARKENPNSGPQISLC